MFLLIGAIMHRKSVAFISFAAMLATFGGQAAIAKPVPPYYKCPPAENSTSRSNMYVIPEVARKTVVILFIPSNSTGEGRTLGKGFPAKFSKRSIRFTTENAHYEVALDSAIMRYRVKAANAHWTSVQCSLEPGTQ